MTPLFKKLNWTGQNPILILNAPNEFGPELAALVGPTTLRSAARIQEVGFVLCFARSLAEVETAAKIFTTATVGDAVVWVAYPKGTSKKYTCEFIRDTGWASLGAAGFEAVRQVAVDADWSALRFRRVDFVKSLAGAESNAISVEGKRRVSSRKSNSAEEIG
jgi:hypothetical protein